MTDTAAAEQRDDPEFTPAIIREALLRIARGRSDAFDAVLHSVHREIEMEGATNVSLHCHALQVDGNGRPRTRALVEAICELTLDYAIPRKTVQAAYAAREAANHGSSAALVKLQREADRLFTDLVNSGEGGELLLFCIAEHVLRLPQIICKMDLKTNPIRACPATRTTPTGASP